MPTGKFGGIIPSYKQGWATHGASAATYLWRGVEGAWPTFLGPTGNRLLDWEGKRNHGSLVNINPATDWVVGKHGWVLNFNGSNAYVNYGNPKNLQITGELTIMSWVKRDQPPTNAVIFAKYGAAGQRSYMLYLGSTGEALFLISGNGSNFIQAASDTVVSTNVYTHITGVYRPSTSVKVFIKGVVGGEETTSIPSSIFNSATDVRLGNSVGYDNPFPGWINGAVVWDRALSDAEILHLHLNPYAMFEYPISLDIFAVPGGLPIPVAMHHYRNLRV